MMMRLVQEMTSCASVEELGMALAMATTEMGFQRYALTHHVDATTILGPTAMRLHNYPEEWVEHYDRQALVFCDPVHRASHMTNLGFRWSSIEQMIVLTKSDREILQMGRERGIADGFTIPANIPEEARGSVSFVVRTGNSVPEPMLHLAKVVGDHAFEAARRLTFGRGQRSAPLLPRLTDRQRDCVLWVARGKSAGEIAIIMNLSKETVTEHITQACMRYGVNKRTLLVIRTVFDGTLTIPDILKGWYPHFLG